MVAGVARRGDALIDRDRGLLDAQLRGKRVGLGHHCAHDRDDLRACVHLRKCRQRQRGDRVPAQAADHLGPDPGADVGHDRRVEPGRCERAGELRQAFAGRAIGLADREARQAAVVVDHARRGDLGGDPIHAADHALGRHPLPLQALRVQALDLAIQERAGQAMKVPVRNACRRWHDGCVRAQQGLDAIERGCHLVRFQCDDDDILRAQFARVGGRPHARAQRAARRVQHQAIAPDRGEVRTARDDADLDAVDLRQMNREIAADRAGAEHADLHGMPRSDVSSA